MNDSRLDRITETVVSAQGEKDRAWQVRFIKEALDEYAEFADEFPAGDNEVHRVKVRLRAAMRHAEIGNWHMAGASLRLAANEIGVVMSR